MAQTTVKSEQIATNAISGTIIADNAITGVHIAQNAILTQHIDDGQVGTSQLAADAVTGAKLADSSVVTANIQDDQVTGDKLANNIQIAGTLGVTGETTLSDSLNMGDNVRLKIGAAPDLQLWHDASNSVIKNSTGSLFLRSDGNIYLQDAGGNENFATFTDNGAVTLYYDNSAKLATSSTGVTLSGNLSMTSNVIYASQIYVNDRVGHRDDASTFIDFDTDIIKFATDGERMRIAANGCVGIAETTPQYTLEVGNSSDKGWGVNLENNTAKVYSKANSSNNDTQTHYQFSNNTGGVGSITTVSSSTAYNTSSDYRLKENVTYSWDATTRLKQLKPCRFNWIVDETNTLEDGFLAHEVSSVVTNAIVGDKDKVDADGNPEYQQIDQGKLVPLLVKTIQELEARITALES